MDAYVRPKVLNSDFWELYRSSDFTFADQALRKMGLYDIACLKETYFPHIIRQFFCTVYFHNDEDRTFTWMSGTEKFTSNFQAFCEALGYPGGNRGLVIHDERARSANDLSFCYPSNPEYPPPNASGMYFSYYTLQTIFRENIVSKMGDLSNCRGANITLMYYAHPKRQQKIDVCDFIFKEILRAVEDRMTPKYSSILQRFLNSVVPPELMKGMKEVQELFTPVRRGKWIDLEGLADPSDVQGGSQSASQGGRAARAQRSGGPSRPTRGAARFFKALFDVCKQSYDVSHRAIQISQDNRRRLNEQARARGLPVDENDPCLVPVPYAQFDMPPIDDSMFYGVDSRVFESSASAARRARAHDREDYSSEEGGSDHSNDEDPEDEEEDEDDIGLA
jgi:hypothetical protein